MSTRNYTLTTSILAGLIVAGLNTNSAAFQKCFKAGQQFGLCFLVLFGIPSIGKGHGFIASTGFIEPLLAPLGNKLSHRGNLVFKAGNVQPSVFKIANITLFGVCQPEFNVITEVPALNVSSAPKGHPVANQKPTEESEEMPEQVGFHWQLGLTELILGMLVGYYFDPIGRAYAYFGQRRTTSCEGIMPKKDNK